MVLDFLQARAGLNLAVSTLKVQVSALSSFLNQRLSEEPLVKRFLASISRKRVPKSRRFPPWDLSTVLESLCKTLFEPTEKLPIKLLTLKTVVLVALVSVRRVGEIQALSVIEPFCIILQDKIILSLDQAFLPKVPSITSIGRKRS